MASIAREQSNQPTQPSSHGEKIIALAGNPNVGKSTVFNQLTGLRQHTGNWAGKTVMNAKGTYRHQAFNYTLVDLPGTYSLTANSPEEEAARNFICFEKPDVTVVVADATCLERNLNLLLQILEITPRVVLCVNLLDEAKKKQIKIELAKLSALLGIPVVGSSARNGKGLEQLKSAVAEMAQNKGPAGPGYQAAYGPVLEQAVAMLQPSVEQAAGGAVSSRWVSLKLLSADAKCLASLTSFLGQNIEEQEQLRQRLAEVRGFLAEKQIDPIAFQDMMVTQSIKQCEEIQKQVVTQKERPFQRQEKYDRLLTSKSVGVPLMLALLFVIFWMTIQGANVPSKWLSQALFALLEPFRTLCSGLALPVWLTALLVDGMYKTLAWVVSVMLPPMAIFFPLFTLMEDIGYLPRVAFNMDRLFQKACAHGKQALTMCMGFGCNACGVVGCRIIDSPRERLIAILTNTFVPCNGRFPTLIAVITMFFAGGAGGSVVSSFLLLMVILLGVGMTLLVSKLLSKTVLKGLPSSFQLELPPFRKPQIGKVIVRSMLDRAIFVLGRAMAVAAPAGILIWVLANVQVGQSSILTHCAGFLQPLGQLMGLDGYILLAFLLGFPANEIVIPALIMSYMMAGSLTDLPTLQQMHQLFITHGWSWVTGLCMLLFSLMHWPCGTTCWTIYKETKSMKWTSMAVLLPTACGVILCILVASVARGLGIA